MIKITKRILYSFYLKIRFFLNSLNTPRRYKSNLRLDFNFHGKLYNRVSAINLAINNFTEITPNYLEIGCADNSTFNCIPVLNKFGVDPFIGGTHRMS